MDNLPLEYAHKMWAHYAEYMRDHQRNTAKTYLWLNVAILAGLKSISTPYGELLPYVVVSAFFATFAVLLGIATLSSLFFGRGAPDPIDKFKQLRIDLKDGDGVLNSILLDYDRDISILKRQTSIKGYLLRFQAGFSIASMMMFLFVFI